jgi:hypothetical protein
MTEVSLRAYARHRKVSLRAVQKAIESGRIQKTPTGQIDVEAADALWASRTAPRPQTAPRNKAIPVPQTEMSARRDEVLHPGPQESRSELPAGNAIDYSRARAVRENYLARLSKIEFEEKSGKLVNRDEVQVTAFNKYRTFRNSMLNIPDRVAAVLAAESDPGRVHEILTNEIRTALQEFSDGNS